MKNKLNQLRVIAARNSKKLAATAAAGSALISANASAALPAEATAALTVVTDFATDMIAGVWPIVGLVVGALAGIGLFKKFIGKAT